MMTMVSAELMKKDKSINEQVERLRVIIGN